MDMNLNLMVDVGVEQMHTEIVLTSVAGTDSQKLELNETDPGNLNASEQENEKRDIVKEGDTVIVHVGYRRYHAITVDRHKTFQHRFGALRHRDLIGKPYGTKVQCAKGFAFVLPFSCELWTRTLPHRTQILYTKDISVIILQLDLRHDSVVAEAGLGSASLSHGFLRAISPNGMLYTFDVAADRVETARDEFKRHGYADCVTLEQRDVCQNGFGLDNRVDALFLDLPTPWLTLETAKRAMKRNVICRFGSFSPCIEQVQRTCNALRYNRFCDIVCLRLGQRVFKVRSTNIPPFGCSSAKLQSNSNEPSNGLMKTLVAVPKRQPSHSGYLVFATKLPGL